MHPEAADKRFRVWVSLINRGMFGPRWAKHGDGVRWVRALEFQRRGVVHYHALLGGVGLKDERRLDWMDVWDELAGFARIEPPRRGGAVRGYVSKYVVKGGEIDLGGPLARAAVVEPSLWEVPLVRPLDCDRAADVEDRDAAAEPGPTLWDAGS